MRKRGFTIIELLTVAAVIVLLIAILAPALSLAKQAAQSAATAGKLDSVAKGCEIWNAEFGAFPQSRGLNPMIVNDPILGGEMMTGSQWLVAQLTGFDQLGWIVPDLQWDVDADGVLTDIDYQDWYSFGPTFDPMPRQGYYADLTASDLMTGEQIAANVERPVHSYLVDQGTPRNFDRGELPFLVDSFGSPVLYWRAATAAEPFSEGDYLTEPSKYSHWDNAVVLGSLNGYDTGGENEGMDLGSGAAANSMRVMGWDATARRDRPEPGTFCGKLYDPVKYGTGAAIVGTVIPRHTTGFILYSPGPDKLYGTADDIANFR